MVLPAQRRAHASSDDEEERLIVGYRQEPSQLQQALLQRHGAMPEASAQAVPATAKGPAEGGCCQAPRLVPSLAGLVDPGSAVEHSSHQDAHASDDELHAVVSSLLPPGGPSLRPKPGMVPIDSPSAQHHPHNGHLQPSTAPLVTLLGPRQGGQHAAGMAEASTPTPGWRTNSRHDTGRQLEQQPGMQQPQEPEQQQQQQQQQQQGYKPKSRPGSSSLSSLLEAQPATKTQSAFTCGPGVNNTTPAPARAASSTAPKRPASSVLYTTPRSQQQPASSKAKKPRFSIKDAPTPATSAAANRPGSSHRPAAAALGGLLGASVTTPLGPPSNKQAVPKAASTPGTCGAAVHAGPEQAQQHQQQQQQQQQLQQQHGPPSAHAQHSAQPEQQAVDIHRQQQLQRAPAQPGTANTSTVPQAAAATPAPSVALQQLLTPAPPSTTDGTTAQATVQDAPNPLHLMSQQRSLHRSFLAALPAQTEVSPVYALKAGGRGRGVGGTLAARLAVLMQRQKQQQDRLAASGPAANAERLELTVVSKCWEANMVKCLCSCNAGHLQQAPGVAAQRARGVAVTGSHTAPQQHQQQVFLFVQSKVAQQSIDLSVGCRVAVHAPWHEVQVPDSPVPIVLSHLLTNLHLDVANT